MTLEEARARKAEFLDRLSAVAGVNGVGVGFDGRLQGHCLQVRLERESPEARLRVAEILGCVPYRVIAAGRVFPLADEEG